MLFDPNGRGILSVSYEQTLQDTLSFPLNIRLSAGLFVLEDLYNF